MTTTILHSEGTTRLVQLAAEYHAGWKNAAELVVADFSETGAEIVRMTSNQIPLNFRLADDEMDVLVEAWLTYRGDLLIQAEAEKQRKEAIIAEAYAIAEEYPAIKIERRDGYYERDQPAWEVSAPSVGWRHNGPVGSPDDLLEMVKCACAAYQSALDGTRRVTRGGERA